MAEGEIRVDTIKFDRMNEESGRMTRRLEWNIIWPAGRGAFLFTELWGYTAENGYCNYLERSGDIATKIHARFKSKDIQYNEITYVRSRIAGTSDEDRNEKALLQARSATSLFSKDVEAPKSGRRYVNKSKY